MSYVPIIIPPAASARAQDLARRLEKSLDEYQRQHPTTSETDVRQALQLVGRSHPQNTTTLIVIGVALLLILGIASFVFLAYRG
jgi:hypothetical protein